MPFAGLTAAVADEGKSIAFDGTKWSDVSAASAPAVAVPQTLPLLGVNATADSTNRLSVSSAAVLFNNAGNGIQAKLNKNAAGDTASLLYQTSWSGRAEMGLAGDDDFRIKVSADGASWNDALVIDRSSGRSRFTQVLASGASSSGPAGDFRNSNAGFTGPLLFLGGSNPVTSAYSLMQGYDLAGGRTAMTIAGNGNVMNANNSYGALSDARLKQDIANAASQWSDIKALKLRRYRLKRDVARDAGAPFQLGLVAQEVAQSSKHLVTAGLVDDLPDAQGIKYSVLYLKALGALQEAMTRIEALEARVGAQ